MIAPSTIPLRATARRTSGHVFAVGAGLSVCRYPLSTAFPIPLDVSGPGAPRLVTWAFGPGGDAALCCLLVIAYAEGARPPDGGLITVETHFHDLIVDCPPVRPLDALALPERDILCEAVLTAITPGNLACLAPFVTPFAPILSAWPVAADAPVLTLARDTDTRAGLSGGAIPDYLLIRAGGIWSCARVVRALRRFGPAPETELTLEPAWGGPAGHPPDRVLLLAPAVATSARIAT